MDVPCWVWVQLEEDVMGQFWRHHPNWDEVRNYIERKIEFNFTTDQVESILEAGKAYHFSGILPAYTAIDMLFDTLRSNKSILREGVLKP